MIKSIEVPPEDAPINFIWQLVSLPYIARWLDDPSVASFVRFVERWRNGETRVFIAFHDGEPIGAIHIERGGCGWEAHCMFHKRGWGHACSAARDARRQVDGEVVAHIPRSNRLACGLASRLGTRTGTLVVDGEECETYTIQPAE